MRLADRMAIPAGLTASRWMLLHVVERAELDDGDWPTVGQVSKQTNLSVQAVSRMVVELDRQGLVRRETRRGSGRSVFVSLTPAGTRTLDAAFESAEPLKRAFLTGFKGKRLTALEADLERLLSNLNDFEQKMENES